MPPETLAEARRGAKAVGRPPPEANPAKPASLVRPSEVHSAIYTDPGVFRLEMQRIFGRAWVLLCHESQIPEIGDWLQGRVGDVPVITVRAGTDDIRVLENRCAHRGAAVCAERSGRAVRFNCPYHAWSFDLTGALKGMPLKREYGQGFDWAAHGLRSLSVERHRGFVFAAIDPQEDLRSFLGSAAQAFDDLIDRSPEGEMAPVPSVQRYRVKANWKFLFENLNDLLHVAGSHNSCLTSIGAMSAADQESLCHSAHNMAASPPAEEMKKLTSFMTPNGHSFYVGKIKNAAGALGSDYHRALEAKWGAERAEEVVARGLDLTLIYASGSVNAKYQTIRLIKPIAVDETEVEAYVFRLKGAPARFFEDARGYALYGGSPASFLLVDDLEVYERCQAAHTRSGGHWISVDRGFAEEQAAPFEGRADATSEAYIRNQYRAWARMMSQA